MQKRAKITDILGKSDAIASTVSTVVTHKAEVVEAPIPAPNSMDKRRLPKIIIITYNKEGKTETEEFICAEITLCKNTKTTLSGAKPTNRRDHMDISIEALVVETSP